MKTRMKSIVALLLVICISTGLIPPEGLALLRANAQAQEQIALQSREAEALMARSELTFSEAASLAQQILGAQGPQSDGEWEYVLLPDYGYAVVTGHRDAGRAQIDIPAVLGGMDVVALLTGVFDDHPALMSVTMAHNIYYAAPGALPRGVTVRGYHGSYASKWAGENLCAFENLSELDFVPGVVDCSDIDPAHFVRHSQNSVTLRALEATRLAVGSVFFLADPDNLYTVSFYRVTAVGAVNSGYVTLTCETPAIAQVLDQYEMNNVAMKPDWSTVRLEDGVKMTEEAPGALTAQERAKESANFDISLTPSIKLGNKGKFTLKVGYSVSSTASAKYAKFKLDSYEIETKESISISGAFSMSADLYEEAEGEGITSVQDQLWDYMVEASQRQQATFNEIEANQKLCEVTLFSIYGVVNFTLEVGVNISFSGKISLTYSCSTVTTHKYLNGELSSKSTKGAQSVELEAEAEVKAGLTISIKVLLLIAQVGELELFVGLKATASYKVGYQEVADAEGITPSVLIQSVEAQEISLAALNMIDCVQLNINFLVELKATLGNDLMTLFTHTMTLGDVPIASLHIHTGLLKFVMDGTQVKIVPKSLSDRFHTAQRCPLMDAITLMAPEVSKKEPVGTVTLFGRTELRDAPEIVLPQHGVRVCGWYCDKELTQPLSWPLPVKSGDIIYGKTEKVNVITVVDYSGEPVKLTGAQDAVFALAEGEVLALEYQDYVSGEDIIGWAEVKSADDLTFVDEPYEGPGPVLMGDGADHTWLAIYKNGLTINFNRPDGEFVDDLKTGHFREIGPESVPEFPILYDEDYAVATYEWRDKDGNVYEFPCRVGPEVGDELDLYMTLTGVERVYEETEDATVIGGAADVPSGLATYSSKDYFTYDLGATYAVITGFKAEQSFVDEEGNTQTWTAVPEKIIIPAYIDDKPVTSISGWAFSEIDSLISVKVPSTVTSIGYGAFANCPELREIDISECTGLTLLPAAFAENDGKLGGISIPGSVETIGDKAFRNCTALTEADVNAEIGDQAFEGCTSLKSVTLRNRVSIIGKYAFRNCTALTSLTVPCSAKTVGEEFISGCTALTTLVFDGAPACVTRGMLTIGEGSSLTDVRMTLGVTELESSLFYNDGHGHYSLRSLTLPDAIRSAGTDVLRYTSVETLNVYDLGVLGYGFAQKCTTLRELTFHKGVIGRNAFKECANLEKVVMGEGVYAIGEYAFYGCSALSEVKLGGNLTHISRYAFSGCKALTAITMGDMVEGVGEYAFENCTSLAQVRLSPALKDLGMYVFKDCTALTEMHFPAAIENMGYGVLHNCTSIRALSIGGPAMPEPDVASILGRQYGSVLESVVLNEGVTKVVDEAFCNPVSNFYVGYSNLRSVTLPSTVTEIGSYAFAKCAALENVTLPAGLEIIGDYAFEGCTALTLECSPDMNLISIGGHAFIDCTSLTFIHLGSKLKQVGTYAFQNCTSLTSIHFPPTVINYGYGVLYSCKGLKHLTIGGEATPVFNIRDWIGQIQESALETVVIGEGVVSIEDGAFSNPVSNYYIGYQSLTSVTLPSTVEYIGDEAFALCRNLQRVTLPAGLKHIGDRAFEECESLQLICSPDMQLESIGDHAFVKCASLTDINLGDSLESLGTYAFMYCTSLQELIVPPSLKDYDYGVVYECTGLKRLSIGGPETPELNLQRFIGRIENSSLETVVIGEGVVTIGPGALRNPISNFYVGHARLTHVSLPTTLECIEEEAFALCSSLTKLTIPVGVTSIGARAFEGCTSLRAIEGPMTQLESIGDEAFRDCTSLRTVPLGNALKTVGMYVFRSCQSLTEIHFPPSVESFGIGVIYDCPAMKHLTIGGPHTPELDADRWLGSTYQSALETVVIGEGVEVLCEDAFSNYSSWHQGFAQLRHVSLPSTLREIGPNAFRACENLETIVIPPSVEVISSGAFEECSALQALQTPVHNVVVEAFTQTLGTAYQPQITTRTLTLMYGDTELCSIDAVIGEDLTALLAKHAPAEEGMAFTGWYRDALRTAAFDATEMTSCALTLYAGMVPAHTATFLIESGSVLFTQQQTAGEGQPLCWPAEPDVSGYRFEGWYTDAALTRALTADAVMGGADMTIYGKLSPYNAGAVYTAAEGGVMLTRFVLMDGESTDVWLPGMVNGKPVVAIASGAFEDAPQITRLHLPDSLVRIADGAFAELENLTAITTGPACEGFTAVNGVLYTADMGTLVCLPRHKPLVSLVVPKDVHTIAAKACASHLWLQSADLGDHVKNVGDRAFAGCSRLNAFTAYGLETIGESAIPTSGSLHVYGPVKAGVLRDYLLVKDGANPIFLAPYNLYHIRLNIDDDVTVVALEAGSTLNEDFFYGEMPDGTIVHTWYTDEFLTTPWERSSQTPAAELSLWAPVTPLYEFEVFSYEEDGESLDGARLTAYHGAGGAVTLPREIGGLPVKGIGSGFLSDCHGVVASVQIGREVIEIADDAFVAPKNHPFGGVVRADTGSYAAQWATDMGYTVNGGLYTLTFETNGGASISERTVTAGAYVRLPVPVLSGCTFVNWYLDEWLNTEVELEDGCFVMPAQNVTLHAEWDGVETVWPFTFEEADGGVVITAYTGAEDATELILPDTVNGLPVTAIGDAAFTGANLTALTIPGSVVSIGWSAFAGSALTEIVLPGVTHLDDRAFAGCEELTGVTVPVLQSIGSHAFDGCIELKALALPASLEECSSEAFSGCPSLTAFTVAEGGAFRASEGVLYKDDAVVCWPAAKQGAFVLPADVTVIGERAFADAAGLTEITLHDSLRQIGPWAFAGCTGLTAFNMTDGMTVAEIPEGAFSGCRALNSVTIGASVTAIGSQAFHGCGALTSVAIPATVTQIASLAFSGLSGQRLTIIGAYDSAACVFAVEQGFAFADPATLAVESLTILPAQPQLTLGSVTAFTAEAAPVGAALGGELTWTSSDPSVVYFYQNEAHAVGLGTAVLIVTAPNGVTASMAVQIVLPPLVPSASALTLLQGQTALAELTQAVEGCVWASSDDTVATVDGGRITAIAPGTVYIACTAADGRSCTIAVTVADSLTAFALPAALSEVEEEAFLGNPALERIALPAKNIAVGSRAFADCTSLVQAEIPAAVSQIAPDAFDGCPAVTILCVQDSAAHHFALAQGLPYAFIGE